MSANFNGGTTFSPINNEVNKLNYNTYSLAIETFKSKMKKYSIYMVAQGGYTVNKSSLQPDAQNNYFFYTLNPSVDIYFLKKFQLHTDANYLWQQKTQAFSDNFNRTIWNGWIARTFLKNDQLTIKLSCNDILNENNGYARTATNTFFSENRFTTIKRFFMIGATWSFTKFNNLKQ
ncbi:outer membrane beta-barrel protein [Niabella ginsengisoli]|uniref:Outer membrane beta-barrel family protein n=1 Tax=Niabella ginsengisoli TaxID=522298 RepID=A0ABS9SNT4_9BACT|nr:outer membrane beta-barrel protein [Niabella ginsengisoli]MCH5599809.1 outer membrane beta-barrel family protein [Niabella ginsengisoli]